MFRLREFAFIAVPLLFVLLLKTNALATQYRDETPRTAAELNEEAVACVKDHQYQQAVELLKAAIALQPNLAMAHYNLGRVYQITNEWDLAIDAFKHAIDLNPEFVAAFHELGFSYNQTARYGDAVECLQRAVKLQPTRVDLLTELGFAYSNNGRVPEAVALLKEAVRLKPDFVDAYNNLGVTYFKTGQVRDAIQPLAAGHPPGTGFGCGSLQSWLRFESRASKRGSHRVIQASADTKPRNG